MLTEKYKPKNIKEIVNQEDTLRIFLKWVENWKKGKSLLLYGPAGIGKNAIVEAYANEKKVDLIQLNASDYRSDSQIREVFGSSMNQQSLFKKGKILLIDEIDGLTGREDAGGVGEIIKIIKESEFPVVLTANDPWIEKLKTLRSYCELIKMKKIYVTDIEKRLKLICYHEKIKTDETILRELARNAKGDLRSAINDLETIALGKKEITQNDVKILSEREREENIFETLRTVFKTKSLKESIQALNKSEKDIDEIFWWIEQNIPNEYQKSEEVAKAFDFLSKADMFKARIIKNQNYRFLKYMREMMAFVSLAKMKTYSNFTLYRPPDRLIILGKTKSLRQEKDKLHAELGKHLHCSKRKVNEQMSFLKIFLTK